MDRRFLFLIIVLILVTLIFSSGSQEGCYPPYKTLHNYSEYTFNINEDELSFAVIDETCSLIKGSESEVIFENYFTLQYANVITNTPEELRTLDDATRILISLMEKPFEDVESETVQNLSNELSLFIMKTNYVDEIYIISTEYQILYDFTDSSLRNNELSKEEIDIFQEKTAHFVYVFLDETNQIQKFIELFIDSDFIELSFKTYDWLEGIGLFKGKKEAILTEQIRRILFDVPIDFTHQNLNK